MGSLTGPNGEAIVDVEAIGRAQAALCIKGLGAKQGTPERVTLQNNMEAREDKQWCVLPRSTVE